MTMGSKKDKSEFNPFPGLRPFLPEESDLFFGREGQSREVVQRLTQRKFVTVIGASGSGKSSLIFCGVIPLFSASSGSGSSDCTTITMRPGTDPVGNLADSIIECSKLSGFAIADKESLVRKISNEPDALTSIFQSKSTEKSGRILIIIDQFEEIFRYGMIGSSRTRQGTPNTFVDLIVNETLNKKNNIFFILTMRSDFIGECAHYQGLTQLINDSNYLIPHMTREDYRSAIKGPVEFAGSTIEEELVESLLNDVGDRTDQLPVLQHALMRTWTYWQQSSHLDRAISMSDYDAVGRMANAMSRHADEAYEELSPRGRSVCEVMFRTITEKGSDNKGVRHPTNVRTISAIARCSEEELFEVVDKFRIPSRSFITPKIDVPLESDSVIDISHESLMRLWDGLRQWVDEEAASVQMYLRLSEASAMYQRGKAGLWRPPDLQLAINWREKNQPSVTWAQRFNPAFERAMVYLSTSEKEFLAEEESKIRIQKRQLRRSRITAMILGTAAIISILFMLFAFIKKVEADQQKEIAVEQTQIATEQEKRATSNEALAVKEKDRADAEAKLAREKEEEARIQAERAEIQRKLAEKNELDARNQKSIAEAKTEEANEQRNLAVLNEQEALSQREKAFSLRMLAVGKQMSVKSLQVVGQQDLQTLLAYQAYIFNKRYNGKPNDADIYTGLYNAVKNYGGEQYRVFTNGHNGQMIKSIAFVPGKNIFYTSGQDGKILKWILDGSPDNFEVVYSGNNSIEVLALSPDATWLAAGGDNSIIKMIPLVGNVPGFELKGHTNKIKSIVFSYDGKYIYSAALDGNVLKWDLAAKTSRNVNDNTIKITQIDVSAGNKFIAGVSEEGEVLIFDQDADSGVFSLDTEHREITSIRFYPGKNILAIGDINGFIELWDVEKRIQLRDGKVKAHDTRVSSISFNPILNQMATGSFDKTVKIWNPDNFTEPPLSFSDNNEKILAIEFSSNGEALVSATTIGEMKSRATNADILAGNICFLVTRNLSTEEWNVYVGEDIAFEKTCVDNGAKIKVEKR